MRIRIATWNINSVRLRLDLVQRFVHVFQPDVLCLQEIKCLDEAFPLAALHELGFPHVAVRGQLGYHGVATASKIPFSVLPLQSFCGTEDARHLGVALEAGAGNPLFIHNLYVPAGGDIPDPDVNPKFRQKLNFLQGLARWCEDESAVTGFPALLAGDLNVAPLETDVWSHKQLLKVVSHTPVEVEHLARAAQAGNWRDAVRHFIPPHEKLYSWWSYRARDWAASDRGRRLDHIWMTPPLLPFAVSAQIVKEARGWDKPSDHVPVIADLDLSR